jgi:membrane-bound ClpP family serine protease
MGTQAGAAHISTMTPQTSFGSLYPLASGDAALSQQNHDLVLDSIATVSMAHAGSQARSCCRGIKLSWWAEGTIWR